METFDLDMEKAVSEVRKAKAKIVCIQLPDGLKPKAKLIADEIRLKTDAMPIIWAGSCFGACDIPEEIKKLNVDLLIQWWHA